MQISLQTLRKFYVQIARVNFSANFPRMYGFFFGIPAIGTKNSVNSQCLFSLHFHSRLET